MESGRVDQRREAGMRTWTRLLNAALDQLAERGEDGVTLRELTDAAGANVAAVSYHFGSLKSLCDDPVAACARTSSTSIATARSRPTPRTMRAGPPRSLLSV